MRRHGESGIMNIAQPCRSGKEMQKPRPEGDQVRPVPQVFNKHDLTAVAKNTRNLAEEVHARTGGPKFVRRENKESGINAVIAKRQHPPIGVL